MHQHHSKRKASTSPPHGEGHQHDGFYSKLLDNRRTIWVYLPPGYSTDRQRRYPVLYLHDGQNLFDSKLAAFGVAWDADATADRLITQGRMDPVLLVGIANTPARLDEYALYPDAREKAGGRGELYARFVLDELKPFIDNEYRTKPGREHTGVAGSSLGGLASLTMAWQFHERLRLCGIVSPSLWWAGGRILKDLERDTAWMKSMRFWVDMGTREGSRRGHVTPTIQRTRELVERFDQAGLIPGRDYYYWEVAGGEHNEAHWAARFDKMLLYFFGR
jgi:predicted alpha/beta superfamily hydrolase